MQDLRLVGVHDDGEHLVLTDSEGGQFRVLVDADLRRCVHPEAEPPAAPTPIRTGRGDDGPVLRPRDVQAMLRSGGSTADVAERAGWTLEKVERYAAPIQAERAHVATMARTLPLRSRGASGQDTFDDRVSARLVARGVEAEQAQWDSWKGDSGRWTVVCRFSAGGRQRQASWLFDPTDRTISATDDEARWLGEDEQSPGPLPMAPARRRGPEAPVYDVEAEGGLEDRPRVTVKSGGSGSPTQVVAHEPVASHDAETAHDTVDLVSAMRERAGRRRRSRRSSRAATTVTPAQETPVDAAPQQHLDMVDAPEPPLGSHPAPEQLEPEAVTGSEPGSEASANATGEDTAQRSTAGATSPSDTSDGASAEPPGHDPVTGTADMFADQDLDEPEPPGDGEPDRGDPQRARTRHRRDRKRPQPPERPSQARSGRPAVPSWDDIMFGSRGPGA